MKTIVLITTSYPSTGDGSEAAGSFVQDFAEELGRKARVLVLAPGVAGLDGGKQQPVKVIRYAATGKPLSLLKFSNPFHWLPMLRVLRAGARELEQLVAGERVDHILALWVLPSGAWAMRMRQKYGIPYSTWALGSDIWSLGKIPFVRAVLRKVLQNSAANYADGHQLCADVEKISARPCAFLPSTRKFEVTADSPLNSGKRGRNLAFLGRWHPNKGIDLLLDALLLLTEEDWQQINEVRIFGGGPLQERVQAGVELLMQQGRRISLGGYLDKVQAAQLFAWTDYVLIPSRIESIPVVFSDAMKAGKPVIAMPVGDLGYLVGEYRCGLAAAGVTAEDFAHSLKGAMHLDRNSFAPGIARAAGDFSLPAITDKFLATL